MTTTHRWTLPTNETAPGLARTAAVQFARLLPTGRLNDVMLLISELVTNSVRHAGLAEDDRIELLVEIQPSLVRVEVHDPGPGFSSGALPPDPTRPFGWGLYLITEVADRWGVSTDGVTRAWFEIDLD